MFTACGVTHKSTRWNSQARGVAMHATEACGQPCVRWCVDLHEIQSYSWPSGRGCVILHETETCSQPCGARGVAAHASGVMRSDTQAATRLVPDWEISYSGYQFKTSLDVGLLEKVEKGFGSQKSGLGSRPRSTKNYMWSTRWNGQALGVAMHATKACGQPCVRWCVDLHALQSCSWPSVRGCVILHETETCSQPCGARGVAAHASGAMRSDTRAAARLVPDCTWRRFCSSEERSVLVETSSRPIWTWVYLRRSRKGSDRRSRVWGQGHGQPKNLNAECLDDIAKLWIVRLLTPHSLLFQVTSSELVEVAGGYAGWCRFASFCLRRFQTITNTTSDWGMGWEALGFGLMGRVSERLALDCLGWDSVGLYLLVGDCNWLSNGRLLTPHSLLFQVTSSELVEVAGG
ncbi:hypothetical protein DY000_02005081 [Brassica cretica]|uniref:Uncharacterized protein n=1 Tax=Brassica cretica TaxID=69181 RepID=A0ABQ7C8D2_BRACR|nr:hypothetical protein DY000_02005081 [Brassica cretica]